MRSTGAEKCGSSPPNTHGHLPFTEAQGREQRATRSSRWTKAGTVSTTTWRATRNQSGRQRPQRARSPAGSSAPPCPTLQGRRGSRAGRARLAEPERGRREAAAHDPPKPGIQGTGLLGVASGSIPEGDLHPLHWMAPSNLGPPFGPTCRVTALACVVRGRGHGMPGASQ